MREARARRRGFSRDRNVVRFADASRTPFAEPPIPHLTVFARVDISIRQAGSILGWQAREFGRHLYGSGVECSGVAESAEVVPFAEDEAAGHGVDGEGDEDAYPCGAVAEGEAEEVPVICDPAPELLAIKLALISPPWFRSVEVGALGYFGQG